MPAPMRAASCSMQCCRRFASDATRSSRRPAHCAPPAGRVFPSSRRLTARVARLPSPRTWARARCAAPVSPACRATGAPAPRWSTTRAAAAWSCRSSTAIGPILPGPAAAGWRAPAPRRRWTGTQSGLRAQERRGNVRQAFDIHPRWLAEVAGKTVLLVDDVLTTGATVEACARVLQRGGARHVDVLTLARVVRPAV